VIFRFDNNLGDAYYSFRRGEEKGTEWLAHCLGLMERAAPAWPFPYGLADIAYAPWLIRLRDLLGFDLSPFPALLRKLDELSERPAIAAELDVVSALAR
jgi:glutathione S-transferase